MMRTGATSARPLFSTLTLDGAVRWRSPLDSIARLAIRHLSGSRAIASTALKPYLAESAPQAALIRWRDLPGGAQAELRITAEETGLRWNVALGGLEHSWRLSFPFLGQLGDDEHSPGEQRLRDSLGRPICYRADWPPPHLWQIPGGPTITLLVEPLAAPMPFDMPTLWSDPGLPFTTSAEPQMVFEACS